MTSVALPTGRVGGSLRTIAWAGIVLGLASAFVALPPISARSWAPSLFLALLAHARRRLRDHARRERFGWYAIAAALLGFGLAYLATRSGIGKLETVVVWSALFASMLRFATPLIFGALGGMFSERSGVVNVGLEGMMLMGAFFGIMGADKLDSWILGLLVGVALRRRDGPPPRDLVDPLPRGPDHLRLCDQLPRARPDRLPLHRHLRAGGTPTDIPSIPNVRLAFLDGVPFLGDIFGNLNLMIWIALLLVPLSWLVLFKTPLGLRLRAVGEHPRAADTVGIDVYAIRYGAVIVSGMLAAAGGAYLSIGFVNSFNENMTDGPGLHRARRGDLRELAPVRRRRRVPAVRVLAARSRSACRSTRAPPRCSSRRSRTSSR